MTEIMHQDFINVRVKTNKNLKNMIPSDKEIEGLIHKIIKIVKRNFSLTQGKTEEHKNSQLKCFKVLSRKQEL